MEEIGKLPYPIGCEIIRHLSKEKTLMTIYGIYMKKMGKKKLVITENVICDKDGVSKYLEKKLKEEGKNIYKKIAKIRYDENTIKNYGNRKRTFNKYVRDIIESDGVENQFKCDFNVFRDRGYFNLILDDEIGEKIYYERMLEKIYNVKVKEKVLMTIHGKFTEKVFLKNMRMFYIKLFKNESEISGYFREGMRRFMETKTGEHNIMEFCYEMSKIRYGDNKLYKYYWSQDSGIENENYDWNKDVKNFVWKVFGGIYSYIEKNIVSTEDINIF